MVKLRLRPLHDALRNALSQANVRAFAKLAAEIAKQTVAKGSAANPSPSEKTELDPRLHAIADKSQLFLERLMEQIPEENRTARPNNQTDAASTTSAVVLRASTTESTMELRSEAAPKPTYPASLRAMLAAAANLQALAQSFTTHWPAQSRPMLPGNSPATGQERTWAPILAWLVLSSIPEYCAAKGDRIELFDRLLIRHALADLFSSMGMEGEAGWQAAAQVRLLLLPVALAPEAIRSEALWNEPDVRWLAGVNVAAGITYFNKQQFEELLTWLQLPILIELSHGEAFQARSEQPSGIASGIAEIEASVAAARKAAQRAGYDLKKYVATTMSTTKIDP